MVMGASASAIFRQDRQCLVALDRGKFRRREANSLQKNKTYLS
jgi:hypothetical protein